MIKVVLAAGEGRSLLAVNDKARVRGMVKATHVIINAEVRGSLQADELLELQPKVRSVGDVRYELLEMHPWAAVEGELRPLKSTERPALKLVTSNDVSFTDPWRYPK